MTFKTWRADLSGGVAAAFAGLPVELVYGLMAVAPLGAAYVGHGLRAALWGCVLAGVLGLVLRTAGGMITGSRPATGLLLGALATVLIERSDIQQLPDPAATVFVLLLLCTSLAGLFQFIFGLVGVGRALKFVPYPVIAGLMCGVGILMARSALKSMLGMPGGATWSDVLQTWHPLSFVVTLATIVFCFKASSITKRIPSAVLALIAGSLLHHLLVAIFGAESLGPTSGGTSGLIPSFSIWQALSDGGASNIINWLPSLIPYAAAIAAFASLECLLCLAAIESAKHERGNGDRELVRQGSVNIFGGILGATPSIGNLSRVMVNLSSGGRSSLSGTAYSATLALIVLFAGRWSSLVPAAVTSGILLFYAQGMVDEGTRRIARQIFSQKSAMPSAQYKSLLANFGVIVLVALVAVLGQMIQALAVGVVAAMFLFVKTSMKPVIRQVGDLTQRRSLKVRALLEQERLDEHGWQIVTIDIDGPLFFGTADRTSLEIEKAATGRESQAGWPMLLQPASEARVDRSRFATRRFGSETGAGARHQRQSPAYLDDQTSASIVGGCHPSTISSTIAVYPGGSGQCTSFADHAAGTGCPAPQWRSAGMVGVAA